jgi:hypothetical protein
MIKNMVSKMGPKLLAMLEKPETVDMVCRVVNGLDAGTITTMSAQVGFPLQPATALSLSKYTTGLRPPHVQRCVKWVKRLHSTYRVSTRAWLRSKPWMRRTKMVLPYVLLLRWWAAVCL